MSLKSVRILLVDDDEDEYIITRDLLSDIADYRHEIHWCNSYQQAILSLETEAFDVCLFDYVLGADCGLELLSEVINRGYDLPIILLTGQNDKNVDQKALENGASDYLDKKLLSGPLLERSIRYAIDRHKTITELKYEQKIFKGGPVVVFKWSASQGWPVEYVSSNVIQFGYLADDLAEGAVSFLSLVFHEDHERVASAIKECGLSSAMSIEQDYRIVLGGGTVKWVYSYTIIIRDHNGEPLHYYGYILDITERKQAEDKLTLAASVYENTNEGILVTDCEGHIENINPAFTRITGYTENETIGKRATFLTINDQSPEFYSEIIEMLNEKGNWQGEIWNRRKNGETYPQWLNISSIRNANGELVHFVGVFSDITEIKEHQERLNYLAHHDPLTDLPNRLLFQDRLKQSISVANRKSSKLGLLFFDLDGFKFVNDSLGHGVGDKMLKIVADRLKDCVREADSVARIGGDEFGAIIPELQTSEDAARVAQKINQAISKQFIIDEHKLFISASLGIAIYPYDGRDEETLLKNADIAMYHAKDRGKNNYQFYTVKMTDNSLKRFEMENSLRLALQNGDFRLLYQPQIDLSTGDIVGSEALVYWQNNGTLISPSNFISLAEETGLIVPIGTWVIQEACAQNKRWQEEGYRPMSVAINLSEKQFQHKGLLDMIRTALSDCRLDPCFLELELTESSIMNDLDLSRKSFSSIKDMGVKLSIDDFGTGYSSLSSLKRFPIDTLKIDQSFIRDIFVNKDDAAITCAAISLGHNLRFQVLAEGVETIDQLNFLLDRNCDRAQGYHFSKPIPAQDYTRLLSSETKFHMSI